MKRKRRIDEETTYWLSYSDMMAGLLLVFVLIISFTMLHAKMQYDEKQTELIGKEQELEVQTAELEEERGIVSQQKTTLDEQEKKLNAQEQALAEQGEKIAIQEETLKEQHELLDKLEAIMSEQQQKLDDIIGVRADLVEDLSNEFNNSDLKVSVDETTGAITFDASILFDYNKSVLKPSGKEFLADFLPRYADVLLSQKYKDNISEILIEGHTDTEGNYMSNLELSQKRALAVAEYCLSDNSKILSDKQLEEMRSLISATGRSYSNPIYDENGKIDMAASRRVEFLFRLTDEEMVREMIEILSEEEKGQTD
ncbi:MAG: OmpA family protein [Lachnospiraceae bacterium]|nr:OmpA family protein [Lachnospiraceae bacterium]